MRCGIGSPPPCKWRREEIGEVSVKNGELSEDERNEMKLIKFFAV